MVSTSVTSVMVSTSVTSVASVTGVNAASAHGTRTQAPAWRLRASAQRSQQLQQCANNSQERAAVIAVPPCILRMPESSCRPHGTQQPPLCLRALTATGCGRPFARSPRAKGQGVRAKGQLSTEKI